MGAIMIRAFITYAASQYMLNGKYNLSYTDREHGE